MNTSSTGIAIVGCGFVADYYMATMAAYPHVKVVGVYDTDPDRLAVFTGFYGLDAYDTLAGLLQNDDVSIVLNLTNPRSHYTVSRQCLEANKHVYSEKPLAMTFEDAQDLVECAKQKELMISSAPCSVLGKAARTLSHAVDQNICGDVKLVYAELDDGMVHQMAYKKWFSASGAPWPYRDEFEVGCALEHSGYYLAWLMEMFGPVKGVTAFSDCVIPNKIESNAPLNPGNTADVSIGILKFESGVVARLSTTIVAPHDHSIRLFGEKGVLYMKECWNNDENVYFRKLVRIRRKTFLSPVKKRIKLPFEVKSNKLRRGNTRMDFLLGVQQMIEYMESMKDGGYLADFSLHVNEVAIALQHAGPEGVKYVTKSRF